MIALAGMLSPRVTPKNAMPGAVLVILLSMLPVPGNAQTSFSQHDFFPATADGETTCSLCHNAGGSAFQNRPTTWSDIPTTTSEITSTEVGPVNGSATTRFCQSCHDGIIAGNDATGRLASTLAITGELRSVHPISVGFSPGSRAGERFQRAGLNARSGSQNGVDNLWYDGKVECVSCHAVHQENPRPNMLKTDQGHDTCLACHPM